MKKTERFKVLAIITAASLGFLPILSLAQDSSARQAVQAEAYAVMEPGTWAFSLGFPNLEGSGFPWGKRLVIEYITVKVILPEGQKVTANIQVPLNKTIIGHHFVMTSQGVFGGQEIFTASHLTRLYADKSVTLADPAGTYTIHMDINRTDVAGTAEVWATVQGYFVSIR